MLEIQQMENAMKRYVNNIRDCSLFEGVTDAELSDVLDYLEAKIVSVSGNQPVFLEGEPARQIGVVLEGSVQVVWEDFYGNRSIVTAVEPGQLFGEVFICAGIDAMPVSVIAASAGEVMLIDGKKIVTVANNTCSFHDQLVSNLLRIVATKSLMLNRKMKIIQKRTTKEKLMSFLLFQAKRYGSNEFTIPYDRQALADYLGVERSAMSAEIGKLCKEGVIECKRSHFKLL